VQCIIFQDGGLTALGANIFNMAVAGTILSYYLYLILKRILPSLAAIFISSWLSVVMAAAFCAFELAISDTSPLNIALPAMLFIHMVIGIGEALITTLILSFISRVRPDLIYTRD
jgi:cobalt/nickel transport system permease protein